MPQSDTQIIRFPSLKKKLGEISRSTVDRWERDKNFPKRIRLGKNSVGWNLEAVEQWLHERENKCKENDNV